MAGSADSAIFSQNVEHHNISYCAIGRVLAVGGAKGSLAFASVGQDPQNPAACVVSELYAAKIGSGECTVAWQPGRSTLALSSHKEKNKVSIMADITGQAKDSAAIPSNTVLKRRLAEMFAPSKLRPADSKVTSEYEFEGKVEAMCWSTDGQQLFVGNSSCGSFLKVIDLGRSGGGSGGGGAAGHAAAAAASLNYDSDFASTRDVAASPHDPFCVAVAIGDDKMGKFLLFDVRASTVTPRAELAFSGPALSLAFHPQFADTLAVAYRKAAASADVIVAIVDHSTMRAKAEIPSHKATRVRWRPHGDESHRAWYAVSSGDAVTVWDPFSPHIPVCSAKSPHSKSDASSVEVTDFVWLNATTIACCGKTKHGARVMLPGFLAATSIPNSARVVWHHRSAHAVALAVAPNGQTLVAGENPAVRGLYAAESRSTGQPFIPDGDSSVPSRGIFNFFKKHKAGSEASESAQNYFTSTQGEVLFETDRRRAARIGNQLPRTLEVVQPMGKGLSYVTNQAPGVFRQLVDGWDSRYVVARRIRNRRREDAPRLAAPLLYDGELSAIAERNAQACEDAALHTSDPRGSMWLQIRHLALLHDEALLLRTTDDLLDFSSINGDFHFAVTLYWTMAIWWMERHEQTSARTACPLLAPAMSRRALEWMTSFMKALRVDDLVVATNETLCVYTVLLPEGAENTLQKSSDVGFSKGQTHIYCSQCRKVALASRYSADGNLRLGAAVCIGCHNKYVHYCAICELPVVGLYAWMKPCGHGGHPEHIAEWLAHNTECPQCATRVTPNGDA